VTFTKPDGTTDKVVVNSYQADTTAWFEYIVDHVGTWKVKFDFPGGYFPAGNYTAAEGAFIGPGPFSFTQSVYYKPSSTAEQTLTVQQEPALSWPPSPLPTDYWTRPISPENREWWPILGGYPATGVEGGGPNWPADTNTYMSNYGFTPYVQAPNTAHIVWRREGSEGGLMGGVLQQTSYLAGIDRPGPGNPTIIYRGKCYQTITKTMDGVPTNVWQCYDLRTGEVFWEQTGNSQTPTVISYISQQFTAVPGATSYVRGLVVELIYVGAGRYIRYDPYTGVATVNVSIAPLTTGTFYKDPYLLTVQNIGNATRPNYRLINWTVMGTPAGTGLGNFKMVVLNNITWPFSSLGTVDYESGIAVNTEAITPPATGVPSYAQIMATSLTTGQLLWNVTASVGFGIFSGSTACADHGKFAVRLNDGHWHCWDLYSGKKLWVSEYSSWPWGCFGPYAVYSAYGLLYYPQYDGVVAYDWDTGKVVWHYIYEAPYPYESPYTGPDGETVMPFSSTVRIADGKLYVANGEHTPSQPITRGWKLHCINATTGEGIWNITGDATAGAGRRLPHSRQRLFRVHVCLRQGQKRHNDLSTVDSYNAGAERRDNGHGH
jgi:hypothetical protein